MNRKLPDFAVLGPLRGGTTSLYHLLDQVDGLCMSEFKEPDYFIEEMNWSKGCDWYCGLFAEPDKICGDISPNYSSSDKFHNVADRLHAANPAARLIVIIRDPTERAISHYRQIWLEGRALPAPDRLDDTFEGRHVIEGSRYMSWLAPYMALFPKEQFLFLPFRQLVEHPADAVRKVCEFVGHDTSNEALAAIQPRWQNASEQLAAVPSWWVAAAEYLRKHDSHLVRTMFRMVPRGLVGRLRAMLPSGTSKRAQLPEFDEAALQRLRQALAADAARLRDYTGLKLSDWSV